jgi:hypothetical protein
MAVRQAGKVYLTGLPAWHTRVVVQCILSDAQSPRDDPEMESSISLLR